MPIPTTPIAASSSSAAATVPIVSGQIYATRRAPGKPFDGFVTIDKPAPHHAIDSGMFMVVGAPHGSANYRHYVGTGEAVLVTGPYAPPFSALAPEVQAFVRERLGEYLKKYPSAYDAPALRDLCSLDAIERAVRNALPATRQLYVEAVDQEVRAYVAMGASARLAVEKDIAARIDGPFHVAVLPESALVSRVRRQITVVIDKIKAGGAPSFVVRAWTAALCGIAEAMLGKPVTPLHVELAICLCRAIATRLDQARNGLRRPVPAVRSTVLAEVTAEYCVPPTAPWITDMFARFMAAYEAD